MIYDSGVQWYVTGVFEKNFDEQFLLGSQITLNQYKLDNLPRAWHIPRFEGSFYVKTNMLSEKLGLRGDFIYNSFSYYPDEKSIRRTNALMDVSISGNYKLGNKITALASIQNMLNNRFERWYGYPTIGINASIGIKVLF
jgi:hypothetical protein